MAQSKVISRPSGQCQSQINMDLYHTKTQPMSGWMTTVGMVNAMIGGTCLVLPHMGLRTGWGFTIIVCIVTGFISYYTAYLIILHLGKGKQIRQCILAHFDNDYRYMIGYCFFIWLSLIPYMIIYFKIICLQIQGLLGYQSVWVGPLVAVGMLIIIFFVRTFHVGEETLAYGIISTIGFVLFILWAILSAPSGTKSVPAFIEPSTLAATMIMAFAIHDFLVQNILKNPNRDQYHGIVRWTFFIGTCIYIFIAFGAFAIVNRQPFKPHPETINDFFRKGQWQNSVVEAVYMTHMISAYPNFLIVSKIRFFQMFKIQIKHRLTPQQILYIISIVGISFLIYLFKIHLDILVTLNGAVIGFFYIIAIPIWIHFKCVFGKRHSGYIQGDQEWNNQIIQNQCQCDNVYKNKFMLYLETVFLVLVIILGLALMARALQNIGTGKT